MRDKLPHEDIINRIESQLDNNDKVRLSDLVIVNDGTSASLKKKAEALVQSIPTLHYRTITPFITK
jgi:dephospho-CoA kinase